MMHYLTMLRILFLTLIVHISYMNLKLELRLKLVILYEPNKCYK